MASPSPRADTSNGGFSERRDNESITVLHVDDETAVGELTASYLEREDDRYRVLTETSPNRALDLVDKETIDCVVSDYQMAEMNGLEFYATLSSRHPDLPFILFTGKGSEEIASRAISAGVTDYVRKRAGRTQYELLGNRIDQAVEQYRAKQRMRYKKQEYEDLFEQAPLMYVLVRDEDGQPVIEDCNDRFVEQLGYDREEIVGRPTTAFFTEESAADVDEGGGYERALSGEFELEERTLRSKDGRTIDTLLRASPRLDDQGNVIGVQSLYLDITAQTERAAELERYETIIEASGDPVYTVDADGRITFINEAFCDLVGYDEDDLVGEHVAIVMDEDDIERGEALIRELLRTEKERGTFEMDLVRSDGDRVTVEANVALLPFEEEFRGTTGIHRVITERKERERELERQNERLEEFASIVSHDLRNPLNVAEGRLELVTEEVESEHLDAIERSHDRMQALIDDLLTLAQQGQTVADVEPVRLESVAKESWKNVDTNDATLVIETAAVVRADESRFRQLLENLFRNAVEHGGSDVTVTVGDLGGDGFFVEDDGRGIPTDDRERVFESGFSTSDAGTGFGLPIVRQIAEAHGWRVSAADGEASGARFAITGVDEIIDP